MKKYIILLLIFITFGCKNINKINLIFYYEDSDEDESFFNEKIKDFNKNNPNITINPVRKSKNGLLNDIKFNKKKVNFIRYPSNDLSEFIEKKILRPSEEIFKKDFLNQFQLKALQTVSINKRIWAIPDNYIKYPLLYYNKSIINNPPKNTDDLIKIFNQLRYKKFINTNIVVANLKEPFFIYPWLNSTGVNLFNEKKIPVLNTKEVITAFQLIYEFKNYYKIIILDLNKEELEKSILNNNVSMIIDGDWKFNYYQKILGDKFGVSSVPLIDEKNTTECMIISTSCYSIIRGTGGRKLVAAKEFIKFMNSIETEKQWIKKGRLPTLKLFESQIPDDPLINNFKDIIKISKAYSVNNSKSINMLNKALRMQLEKLVDDNISPILAAQHAQEYFEKIYKDNMSE